MALTELLIDNEGNFVDKEGNKVNARPIGEPKLFNDLIPESADAYINSEAHNLFRYGWITARQYYVIEELID